jgi:hypothetical protein
MATNRDIVVYSTFALAVLMLIWCSGLLAFNGAMLLDLLKDPSLFSATLFCYLSFVVLAMILIFGFSVFIFIDHQQIKNGSSHKSLFPTSYRTDIKVMIIVFNYIIIAGMVSALAYAFSNMGWQATVCIIIVYLYPIVTSFLDYYYVQTLPSTE